MPIIQFVMPSRNKQLKKLLHFYWEVCPKYDENGKLKQEMILVVYVRIFPTSDPYLLLTSCQQCNP
jgi:vesicle coat complex subunit